MTNFFNQIGAVIASIGLAIASLFSGPAPVPTPVDISALENHIASVELDVNNLANTVVMLRGLGQLGATNAVETPIALFQTSLANSITSAATSMTLVSSLTKDGTTLASSTYSFIIDEGTASEEFVDADCTGTICTNMTRGLSVITGTTTVSALQKAHRRGASVKITDAPLLLKLTRIINGIGTLPNIVSYTSAPTFTTGLQIVDKTYVDGVAVAGASNADTVTKGIVEIATALETASSTALGSTGATLAIPASVATDTPNTATRGSRVLMSQIGGYLKQAWLDLTEAWSWSGLGTFSGGLTSSATTTLAGSNVLSNAIEINTVPYSFPSSGIASSTVWAFDSTGKATYEPMQSYASGQFSTTTGIGDLVITHNMGAVPRMVVITTYAANGSNNAFEQQHGSATAVGGGTSTSMCRDSTGTVAINTDASSIINMKGAASCTASQFYTATLSAWTSTTFTLNFTIANGTGGGTALLGQWEAYQ